MISDKLSSETLTTLFTSIKNKEFSGETNNLEFKEKYGHKNYSEYMRTMAAFANTSGGYLIFGIHDFTQELIGLRDWTHSEFKNLDNAELANLLRDQFNRDIRWERKLFTYDEMDFGVIYVFELTNKPVISRKDYGKLKRSNIYYRYNGVSTIIEPGDLEDIIEKEKHRLVSELLNKIQLIGNLGVENTSILSLKDGEILSSSESPANIIVDSEAIEKIKFIQEGHFTETDGEPTLILKGVVQNVIPSNPIIVNTTSPTAILEYQIIKDFLRMKDVEKPIEYLKSICNTSTANYPIYYYLNKIDEPTEKVIDILQTLEVMGKNSTRRKLINRLSNNTTLYYRPILEKGEVADMKRDYLKNILSQTLEYPIKMGEKRKKLEYLLLSIQALKIKEIIEHKDFILSLLLKIYNSEILGSDKRDNARHEFRIAVCWIDEALYKSNDK